MKSANAFNAMKRYFAPNLQLQTLLNIWNENMNYSAQRPKKPFVRHQPIMDFANMNKYDQKNPHQISVGTESWRYDC